MSKPTNPPESTKLLPCPFCGKTDQLALGHLAEPNDWFIECGRCDMGQHALHIKEKAIAAWNQRAPAASPVAPPESDEERDSNECASCNTTMGIPCGLERTEVCNLCAQEERLELKQKLAKLASPVAGGSARIAEIEARLVDYADGKFLDAAPEDIAYLLKLVPEGWVKVTPETMPESIGDYLVVGMYGNARWMDVKTFVDGEFKGCHNGDRATHWWKIPDFPAAEEERSSL